MKKLKDIFESIKKVIANNKIKSLGLAGLTALVLTTGIKDNVHFGTTILNNPQENHYVWGVFPKTVIKGDEVKGNFRTYGVIYGRNNVKDSSKVEGEIDAYGLLFGTNDVGNSSEVEGGMGAYSLILGENGIGNSSKVEGGMGAYSLILGVNGVGDNTNIKGDVSTRGIFSFGHKGFSPGGYSEKNADFTKIVDKSE